MTTNPIEWNKGNTPPERGWYLCAVNKGDPNYLITLMLWYNPVLHGKWYFSCGVRETEGIEYNPSEILTGEWGEQYGIVKAWAKVPKCNLSEFPE